MKKVELVDDPAQILRTRRILIGIIGILALFSVFQIVQAAAWQSELRGLSGQISVKDKVVEEITKSKQSSGLQRAAEASYSAANTLFASRAAWAAQANHVILEKVAGSSAATPIVSDPLKGTMSTFASRPIDITFVGQSRQVFQALEDLRGTGAPFRYQSIDFAQMSDPLQKGTTRANVRVIIFARAD